MAAGFEPAKIEVSKPLPYRAHGAFNLSATPRPFADLILPETLIPKRALGGKIFGMSLEIQSADGKWHDLGVSQVYLDLQLPSVEHLGVEAAAISFDANFCGESAPPLQGREVRIETSEGQWVEGRVVGYTTDPTQPFSVDIAVDDWGPKIT